MTVLDEARFAAVSEQHRHELRVHGYRMLGSIEQAEDAVQEALLKAWRARDSFEGDPSVGVRAWLYRILTTTCLDVLPAAVAPGVSAPAPRGVDLDVIESVIDAVASCGKLRLADIAELNPAFDIDQRTARVAARLVARIVETAGA